jgi:hypothetical protein
MRLAFLGVIAVLLAGCASLDAGSCRGTDWYDIGFRDALMYSIQRQDDMYAQQCERHGVKVDVARYVQGWTEGKYEADYRRAQSHD